MEQLSVSCYGVEVKLVDAAGIEVCRRLRDALQPEFTVVSGLGSPAVSYHVDTAPTDPPAYTLTRDGSPICVEAMAHTLLHCLRQDIDLCVAQRSRRLLFVHAGVVGWRGRAILVVGRSHAGKSTLVTELVRRGAVYYSDEYAVVDEEGMVHPYSRTPVLRDERVTVHDLRLVREDEPTTPLPIALIVAGEYRSGVTWRPTVVGGTRAVLPLIDSTVLAREESAAMLQVMARIAPDAVALMGPRSEAADVAAQLLELVDDALVSRALVPDDTRANGFAADLRRVAERRLQSRAVRPLPPNRRLRAARYVHMLDFLSPDEHQRLLDHALATQDDFQESGIVGQRGENTLNYDVRRSRTLKPARLEEIWEIFERRLSGILPGVRRELDTRYFRLSKVERQLTAHGRGGFFAPHIDTGHPIAASRRISGVYYFHATPQQFSGGELRLYDTWLMPTGSTAAGTYTTLAPVDNSLIFFPSDAFHEVCTVRSDTDTFAGSRFTVTIWFHEQQTSAQTPASELNVARAEGAASATR